MKKKIIAITTICILLFGLSTTAMAASLKSAAATGSLSQISAVDREQIASLVAAVSSNRAAILNLDSANIKLSAQLRQLLAKVKSDSEKTISQDTLDQLNALKAQLKSSRDAYAATKGQVDSAKASFRTARQQRDAAGMITALQSVTSVQQTRISTKTQINSIMQQMIDLLSK